MQIKQKILFILLFLGFNGFNYFFIELNSQHKIDIVLKDDLRTLSTHYELLLETQRTTASAVHQSTLEMPRVTEIMSEANHATKIEKIKLRNELHKMLANMYTIIKQKGVLQYHFLLPNNESFYRAHKPSKFGDDLTDIRADFKHTNATKQATRGLVQGRVAHGFRNTFPLFDKNNKHIGAMEVSFSSDSFQWYLNHISNIHSHFLINKSIFDAKTWLRDDLVLKYHQSAESQDHMVTLDHTHSKETCIYANHQKLQSVQKEIDIKMILDKPFSLYVQNIKEKNEIEVLSFLPIKNVEEKTLAWIVSYEKSPLIQSALFNSFVLKSISLFISLLILYFMIKQVYIKQKLREKNKQIKREHQLVNNVLNLTDDMMFITDFKDVKFSNNKFRKILNVSDNTMFNQSSNHKLLNIFQNVEGSLHEDLLGKGEAFISLLTRTASEDRVVTVLDENYDSKAFKISITRTENLSDYLVTLSDITELKEQHIQAHKKAYIDGLTNIYNRNKFDEIFETEMEAVKRYRHPLCLAILDIDHFKNFNDTHGHLIGDEVLINLAQSVNTKVRETDTFARWGGEEFVILFKETSIDHAKIVAEKLRENIEEISHPTAGVITASFGITEYKEGDDLKSLFKRCDEALYTAKENGRNRVEVSI